MSYVLTYTIYDVAVFGCSSGRNLHPYAE